MGKRIRQGVWAWLAGALALGLAIQPVLAAPGMRPGLQEGAFDPLLREAVARGVAATAGAPASAVSAPVTGGPGSIVAGRRPMPVPIPVPGADATPVPHEDPVPVPRADEDPPGTDWSQRVEYSGGGITFQVPLDWNVSEDVFDPFFEISIPGSNVYAVIQDGGDDLPGLLMVVLFTGLPDMLLETFLDGGTVTQVTRVQTIPQQVPMVAVHYDMRIDGLDGSGVIYMISPGEKTYLLSAFAPADEWERWLSSIALLAQTLVFDEELLTLVTAEGGDLTYTHSGGLIETTIPEGWHVTSTHDGTFPLFVADPGYAFGAVLGVDAAAGADLGPLADELLGDLDSEWTQETLDWVFDELAGVMSQKDDFAVDEALNAYYPRTGALTFRMAGEGDLGDGLTMPVVVYFDLRADGPVMQLVFGDVERALEMEPDLLAILASTTVVLEE